MGQWVENPPAVQQTKETWAQSLGQNDPLEEENGNPLQYSCLKSSIDRGSWWATFQSVPKSQTRLRDCMHAMFIAALFTVTKTWEQHRCLLMDEWIKMWYIYTIEYYLVIKNEILPFSATCMDLEIIILSEISHRKTNMTSLICEI